MKYKILGVLFGTLLLTLSFGLVYSAFHTTGKLNSENLGVAKFIFNTDIKDKLDFPLIDLKPGDIKEYDFSVCNSNENNISEVSMEYEIIISTYHLIPLDLLLYKLDGEEEEEILRCEEGENFSRNEVNYLVCKTPSRNLSHNQEVVDSYKLRIQFKENYHDEIYSELVDFINMEVKSWQKLKG